MVLMPSRPAMLGNYLPITGDWMTVNLLQTAHDVSKIEELAHEFVEAVGKAAKSNG